MHGARDHLGACARLNERKGHQRRGLPAYQNGGVKAQQALHHTAAPAGRQPACVPHSSTAACSRQSPSGDVIARVLLMPPCRVRT